MIFSLTFVSFIVTSAKAYISIVFSCFLRCGFLSLAIRYRNNNNFTSTLCETTALKGVSAGCMLCETTALKGVSSGCMDMGRIQYTFPFYDNTNINRIFQRLLTITVWLVGFMVLNATFNNMLVISWLNKGNNKITEHRAIFQRESQNS